MQNYYKFNWIKKKCNNQLMHVKTLKRFGFGYNFKNVNLVTHL